MKIADKTEKLMRDVLKEVRGLRRDVSLILPTESVSGYAHPRRIVSSYNRATKLYPARKN